MAAVFLDSTYMKDIEARADIELLVREFYSRLLSDPSINYIFTEVAKINLEDHIPHLVDFWEQSLFHTGSYKKNVMQLHLDLNEKEQLTLTHFNTWLAHFEATVNNFYSGHNADKIVTRAHSVATIMKIKMNAF